jgi:MFS family permease
MLLLTGLAAFALGLLMVERIPYRFKLALKGMTEHRVLELTNADTERLYSIIKKMKNRWSFRFALFSAVAMLIAFIIAFFQDYTLSPDRIWLTLFEVAGAYIAGFYIGRTIIGYGWFAIALRKEKFTLRLIPDHLDGAAGLRPIGNFYLFQTIVVAIPALFVGVWALLISLVPRYRDLYGHWRISYILLLLLTLTFVVLALILPMWSLHKLMENEKRELLKDADDNLYAKILEIDTLLKANLENKEYDDWFQNQNLKDKLQEQFRVIERTPTWPFDVTPRNAFFATVTLDLVSLLSGLIAIIDFVLNQQH